MAGPSLLLAADNLWSKAGFYDGDLAGNYLCAIADSNDALWSTIHAINSRDLLIQLVERYLIPALPGPIEVDHVVGHHNPIRARGYDEKPMPPEFAGVSVLVSRLEVLAIADELFAAKGGCPGAASEAPVPYVIGTGPGATVMIGREAVGVTVGGDYGAVPARGEVWLNGRMLGSIADGSMRVTHPLSAATDLNVPLDLKALGGEMSVSGTIKWKGGWGLWGLGKAAERRWLLRQIRSRRPAAQRGGRQ